MTENLAAPPLYACVWQKIDGEKKKCLGKYWKIALISRLGWLMGKIRSGKRSNCEEEKENSSFSPWTRWPKPEPKAWSSSNWKVSLAIFSSSLNPRFSPSHTTLNSLCVSSVLLWITLVFFFVLVADWTRTVSNWSPYRFSHALHGIAFSLSSLSPASAKYRCLLLQTSHLDVLFSYT